MMNTVDKDATKRTFIVIPKMLVADLEKHYELEHGLIVKQLNPYINEAYLQAYFRDLGKVTGCKIIKNYKSEDCKAIGFVRFATADEADMADWAGPHFIGSDVEVRRVVSPKMDKDDLSLSTSAAAVSHKDTTKRTFIFIPKMFVADLEKHYELEHGLIVKQLNPYINEAYLQAYFRDLGKVTGCKIIKNYKSEDCKAIGFVRFATADEADKADWAGPHFIGSEVEVRRVVCPKMDNQDDLSLSTSAAAVSRPRMSMGLGYIFEDAQWLDGLTDVHV
ncbi:Heterogeneous nuclear ribonucleoprotein A0 [Merluccius polli]|uniref:Heterogeneous nuclear ribonucleoprotein A0 n=1 Tax=Merluccius polli TaxID=89951 RepID=A0AA47MCH9_MERPO|nr:Heterogeneous nuclear ribonucleoprotein A0 [Merluccius polli]